MKPEEIVDSLIDSATAAVQGIDVPNPDGLLLHFTDAAGLIGILQSKTLWGTRASCMNDTSELTHGKVLAREVVQGRIGAEPNARFAATWKTALEHFNAHADTPSGRRLHTDAFVTSFCARADKSVHWLSYGRGGFGYAVGIDSSLLDLAGWSLVPVIYDEAEQRRVLAEIYDKIQVAVATLADTFKSAPPIVDMIESIAGDLVADVTGLIAPWYKHPCFAAEEEWRLFRPRVEGKNVKPERMFPLKFRAYRDWVVPYAEFVVKPEAFRKVIMGSQVPDHPTRQSLRLLLRENGIDLATCEIEQSNVPVRGAPQSR
jgi:hypothetical protein